MGLVFLLSLLLNTIKCVPTVTLLDQFPSPQMVQTHFSIQCIMVCRTYLLSKQTRDREPFSRDDRINFLLVCHPCIRQTQGQWRKNELYVRESYKRKQKDNIVSKPIFFTKSHKFPLIKCIKKKNVVISYCGSPSKALIGMSSNDNAFQ